MGSQQFCLRWNNHQTNLVNVFEELLTDETLVDVTLACEGLCVRAHKVVLSACSPYFKEIFVHNPCKHPIVIMKDINFAEMRAIIEFMYKGEVNISHEQLPAFLKTAETLKVKGLAEVRNEQKSFAHEEESREVADEIEPTNNNNINNTNNNTLAPTPVVARSAPEVVNHPPPERNSPSPKRKRRNGRNVSESSESAKTSSKSSEAVEILPEIIKIEQDDNERDDEIPMVEEIARGVMGDSAQNKMANQEDSSNSFIQVDPADMPSFVTDQSWDDHSNSGNHLQPTAGGSGIQSTSQDGFFRPIGPTRKQRNYPPENLLL
uniref:BTB domain-containing protein n=1 Tax=Strigamia maritima TaxID=126957 RepID=T1JMY1_STRMM